MSTLNLTQEWDKTFPLSESVHHRKVMFDNQFGLTLAAVDFLSRQENVDAELAGIKVSWSSASWDSSP